MRTVERATIQLMPSADVPIAESLRRTHALPIPSKGKTEKELAT